MSTVILVASIAVLAIWVISAVFETGRRCPERAYPQELGRNNMGPWRLSRKRERG